MIQKYNMVFFSKVLNWWPTGQIRPTNQFSLALWSLLEYIEIDRKNSESGVDLALKHIFLTSFGPPWKLVETPWFIYFRKFPSCNVLNWIFSGQFLSVISFDTTDEIDDERSIKKLVWLCMLTIYFDYCERSIGYMDILKSTYGNSRRSLLSCSLLLKT